MPIFHLKYVFKLPFISDRNTPIALGGSIIHVIVHLCSLCRSSVLPPRGDKQNMLLQNASLCSPPKEFSLLVSTFLNC